MDKEDLVVSEFGDFSYNVLFSKSGLGSSKRAIENTDLNEQKFKEVEDLLKRNYSNIIIGGPGFFKEDFRKYLKDKGINTISFSYNEVSSHSIQKAIDKLGKEGILKDNILAKEQEELDKLLLNMKKQEKCSYGFDETKNAINEGKVEKLYISTKFIETAKEQDNYTEIGNLMKLVEDMKGDLIIINSSHEPGKILDGFGGFASVDRY
jgi:protein pelota